MSRVRSGFGLGFKSGPLPVVKPALSILTPTPHPRRMRIRRRLVEVDNNRNAYFVDSMANNEAVKLFGNEEHEAGVFDTYLASIQRRNLENTYSIGVLNVGQAAIFSVGLTAVMFFTAMEVRREWESKDRPVTPLLRQNSFV